MALPCCSCSYHVSQACLSLRFPPITFLGTSYILTYLRNQYWYQYQERDEHLLANCLAPAGKKNIMGSSLQKTRYIPTLSLPSQVGSSLLQCSNLSARARPLWYLPPKKIHVFLSPSLSLSERFLRITRGKKREKKMRTRAFFT